MRASLDGLMENGEPVELKCPSQKVFEEVRNEEEQSTAYQLYYPQVQHQILVTGANQGWLVFYRDGKLYEILVDRDEAMIREILSEARKFWSDLEAGKAPEKDPERDLYIPQGEEASQWIFAAEEYRLCDGEIKALNKALKPLKQRLAALEARQKPHLETVKSMMGEFYHADYCGLMVTKYRSAGRVNYKRLLAEKAPELTEKDIEQYREKASERCRVTVSEEVKPRYIVDEEALAPLENVPEEIETLYF
jgi:predicted phage-related endonuclease